MIRKRYAHIFVASYMMSYTDINITACHADNYKSFGAVSAASRGLAEGCETVDEEACNVEDVVVCLNLLTRQPHALL